MSDHWVHIRYPHDDHRPDDEAWLTTAAVRHQGRLSEEYLLSDPLQRFARFPTAQEAESFAADLTATGRWTGHTTAAGCAFCSPTE